MKKFWRFWFLSGVTGEYVDLDFKFPLLRGHLHLVYGDVKVCTNPAHG